MITDPRGDLSQVDEEARKDHLWNIVKILDMDLSEGEIANTLQTYVREYLRPEPEVFIRVADLLKEHKILSKQQLRSFLEPVFDCDLSEGHLGDM